MNQQHDQTTMVLGKEKRKECSTCTISFFSVQLTTRKKNAHDENWPARSIYLFDIRTSAFSSLAGRFSFLFPRRARENRRESIDMAVRIWVATFSLITCGFESGCSIYC